MHSSPQTIWSAAQDLLRPRQVFDGAIPTGILRRTAAVPGMHHDEGRVRGRQFHLNAPPAAKRHARRSAGWVRVELLVQLGRKMHGSD